METPQTIDVTGLSPEAFSLVLSLVHLLRKVPPAVPPNIADPEKWARDFRAWIESHPKRDLVIDDSRETIYAGRGE